MSKKTEIANKFQLTIAHGDYPAIAEMAGTTADYVSQVLKGDRSYTSVTGKKIIVAAQCLGITKKNLLSLFKTEGDNFSMKEDYFIPITKLITS